MKKNVKIFLSILLIMSYSYYGYSQEAGQNNAATSGIYAEEPNNFEEPLIDFTAFETALSQANLFEASEVDRKAKSSELPDDQIDPETLQPKYRLNPKDLSYKNWIVKLSSSADTTKSRNYSYAKTVSLIEGRKFTGVDQGSSTNVLGVRIHFPQTPFKASADIMPPFEIPVYDLDGAVISRKKTGKYLGIIDNVGIMKKITMDVSSRNYRHGISIKLKDNHDNISEYFLGYLGFTNWRKLTWMNPEYDANKIHIYKLSYGPVYPKALPYKKFHAISVYKPDRVEGGDCVLYFKKVSISFDYAVAYNRLDDLSINDEEAWGIIEFDANENRKRDNRKLATLIDKYRFEYMKKGQNLKSSEDEDNKAGNQGNNNPQA